MGGLFRQLEQRPRLLLAVALAAGLALAWALQTRPPPTKALRLTPVVESVLTDPGSPRIGAAHPDVVVVVFTDYRCAICRKTDPALARLLDTDPGVQVIYKDWPILGEQSLAGAQIAMAAHRLGQYAQMHRTLMTERGPLSLEAAPRLAAHARVDPKALAAALQNEHEAIGAQLNRHRAQAFALGLQGTPAYLVGPYLIQGGLDDRKLAALVARARRSGPPRP